MSDLRARLRKFILTRFLQGEAEANLTDDVPLKSVVLDSLATLQLVSFIEQEEGLEIEPKDVRDHFANIASIVAFVEGKKRQ